MEQFLKDLSKYAIDHDLIETSNLYHTLDSFDPEIIKMIPQDWKNKDENFIVKVFVDKNPFSGYHKSGGARLYIDGCNFKWFWGYDASDPQKFKWNYS